MKGRNHYIDFVKGLATFSVVLIHCAWWSGTSYVPSAFAELTLLVDVPIFFFLSGMTAGLDLERTFKRLVRLQFSFLVYCALLAFLIWTCRRLGMSTVKVDYSLLLNWLGHNYVHSPPFPVAIASMWFLQIYMLVTLLGTGLLGLLALRERWALFCILTLNVVLVFVLKAEQSAALQMTLFYGLIYVAGHLLKNVELSFRHLIALWAPLTIALCGISLAFPSSGFFQLQRHKFPPDLIYLLYSCWSLSLVLFFKTRLTPSETVVTYVGRNAIYFYFAQGISSSILVFLVPRVQGLWPWYAILPCMCAVNLAMASVMAVGIKWIDERTLMALLRLRESWNTGDRAPKEATCAKRAA